MIGLEDVKNARKRIKHMIYETPLVQSQWINEEFQAKVFFKLENLQVTNAFKIRGSANKILQLSRSEKFQGIITASSGNHAQGFSCAAQKLGIDALVVMPRTSPQNKVVKCEEYGAKVLIKGKYYDDSCKYAKDLAKKSGRIFIPSFDDEQVIAGNGTISLEILEKEEIDIIIAPVGGGGLISGMGLVAKNHPRNVTVIGVEPMNAPSMTKAIEIGKTIALSSISTIADGIAVKEAGKLNLEYVKKYVDEIILVSDEEMEEATRLLWEKLKIVAETAGAASFAAALKIKEKLKGQKIACIVSGGNIDRCVYSKILNPNLKN